MDKEYKTCKKCNEIFERTSENFYGRSSYCKECHKKMNRENTKKNKQRHYQSTRKYIRKNKKKYNLYQKKYQTNQRNQLHDTYILSCLRHRSNTSKSYYKVDIEEYSDIVDMQREKLKLERQIKKLV